MGELENFDDIPADCLIPVNDNRAWCSDDGTTKYYQIKSGKNKGRILILEKYCSPHKIMNGGPFFNN